MHILTRFFLGFLIFAVLGPVTGVAAQQEPVESPRALIVTIDGEIATTTPALLSRATREVRSLGARYLVLEISSTGGRIDSMREVNDTLRALRKDDITTVAYVDEFAFSAAAMIALTCDRIFMKPGSSIGAATPVKYNPLTGEFQEMPDDVRRKMIEATKSLMRSAVEGSERSVKSPDVLLVVDAMIDPDLRVYEVTYQDESGIEQTRLVEDAELERMRKDPKVAFSVDPIEFKKRPLTLTPDEAVRFGVVDGKEDTLNSMVTDELHLEISQVARLAETWSEDFVTWLNQMRSVLFVLGFILLLIEFKTPGFALPGILGVVMFGLAFFGAYMVDLAGIGEILLFFLGLGLLAAEIFFFPGTVFFATAGFLCIVAGLILAQQDFVIPADAQQQDVFLNNLTNFGLIMLVVMVLTWLIYTNIHRIPILRLAVQPPPEPHGAGRATSSAYEARLAQLVGIEGDLACDLRPAGWMDIGGERYDVVSEGAFLAKGSRVKVIEVRGNRVVVAPAPSGTDAAERGAVDLGVLVLLLLVGLALVVAEVFFVSAGILGILSGISLVSAVFLAFAHHGQFWGFTFLATCALGVPLTIRWAFKVLPHTPMGKHLYLEGSKHEEVTGGAQQRGLGALLGQTGVASCDLRPSGFADIGGRRVDVVTRGEMLPQGSRLRVIKIELNQVVVASDTPD